MGATQVLQGADAGLNLSSLQRLETDAERARAVDALAAAGSSVPAEVVDFLIPLVASRDRNLQRAAVRALGQIRKRRGLCALQICRYHQKLTWLWEGGLIGLEDFRASVSVVAEALAGLILSLENEHRRAETADFIGSCFPFVIVEVTLLELRQLGEDNRKAFNALRYLQKTFVQCDDVC